MRVRALPADGEANDAVIALLAKKLKLQKSNVSLERGSASRIKTLRLSGDRSGHRGGAGKDHTRAKRERKNSGRQSYRG
jgi:hypothetical protein